MVTSAAGGCCAVRCRRHRSRCRATPPGDQGQRSGGEPEGEARRADRRRALLATEGDRVDRHHPDRPNGAAQAPQVAEHRQPFLQHQRRQRPRQRPEQRRTRPPQRRSAAGRGDGAEAVVATGERARKHGERPERRRRGRQPKRPTIEAQGGVVAVASGGHRAPGPAERGRTEGGPRRRQGGDTAAPPGVEAVDELRRRKGGPGGPRADHQGQASDRKEAPRPLGRDKPGDQRHHDHRERGGRRQ